MAFISHLSWSTKIPNGFYSPLARVADDFALIKINGEVFRLQRADSPEESERQRIARTYVSPDQAVQVQIEIEASAPIGTLQVQYGGKTVTITGRSSAGINP